MRILDLIAPPTCAFCGTLSRPPEGRICAGCFEDLPWTSPALSTSPGIFECSVVMLHYSFPVDAAIKALKFNRKLYYAPAFVDVLALARPMLPTDIDALIAVPLHWRRKTRRGFNQATELAMPLARVLGVPVIRGVRRCKATPFQSGLTAAMRARNLRHAFKVTRRCHYKHVLIVDDVVTTGATTESLAKALLASGAGKVSLLAVARAG